jgi:hypothetical protein
MSFNQFVENVVVETNMPNMAQGGAMGYGVPNETYMD